MICGEIYIEDDDNTKENWQKPISIKKIHSKRAYILFDLISKFLLPVNKFEYQSLQGNRKVDFIVL